MGGLCPAGLGLSPFCPIMMESCNHRIIELFMLEKASKVINPTLNPALPSLLLNPIYVFSEYLQGWCLHHFLDILFQYLTTLQVNKFFLMEDGCCLPRTLKACVLGSVEASSTALRCEMCCLHGDSEDGE